jgi:hypothetical protein
LITAGELNMEVDDINEDYILSIVRTWLKEMNYNKEARKNIIKIEKCKKTIIIQFDSNKRE